jgi:hypothetical protein
VSSEGGTEPKWNHDGSKLFYIDAGATLHEVDLRADLAFHVIRDTILFPIASSSMMEFAEFPPAHYDVIGDRFLVREIPGGLDRDPVVVVTGAQ